MLEQELEIAKHAVQEAGEAILHIAEKYYKTAPKGVDRTVVTEADIEADRILRDHLQGRFPAYGWLSEETKDDTSRFRRDRVWIVDPMDGTREFVMKVPEFVVSVALAERGRIILGVILNPNTRELFEAVQEAGARLNGRLVRCDRPLDGKPKVEVSRSDIEKNRFSGYESHLELRPVGSIAYKLARLAAGKADATLSVTPKNEWDIAAGVLLTTEAGGKVTDLAGQPHQFNRRDTLLDGVIAASVTAYGPVKQAVSAIGGRKGT
jgi:myo-inositol-1(or 4)-monophosphatase